MGREGFQQCQAAAHQRPGSAVPPRWLIRAVTSIAGVLLLFTRTTAADTLFLRGGERLVGQVIETTADQVIFHSENLGRLVLPRSRVERIDRAEPAAPAAPGEDPAPTPAPALSLAPAPMPALATNLTLDLPPSSPAPARGGSISPPPSRDYLRIYGGNGLRYEVVHPIHLRDPFFGTTNVIGEGILARGRLGLKASVDGATYAGGNKPFGTSADAEVRALRFYMTGELGRRGTNIFKLDLGTIDWDFYLHEAYLRFQDVPYVRNVTLGYIPAPQTLGQLASFGELPLMEASSPSLAFSPGNRTGLQFDRTFLNDRMTATVGLYSVGQDPTLDLGDASDALARPIGRFTGLVIDRRDPKKPVRMHLGASIGYVFADEASIQYRATPESHLAPTLVDTGVIEAREAWIAGVEAVYQHGPLGLASEWVSSRVDAEASPLSFWGWHTTATWVLTGESRAYDRKAGLTTGLVPDHPLGWRARGWGALEAAARYSFLDLSDGPVAGGRMHVVMPGLNWYWNPHWRWQFNYGYANILGGPTPGDVHLFQMRLQLMY